LEADQAAQQNAAKGRTGMADLMTASHMRRRIELTRRGGLE